MKADKSILWTFGALATVLGILLFIADAPLDFLSGGPARPVPGKVYQLTSDNLATARRHAPVLVALYTSQGNMTGARMSRGLSLLAESVKDRAVVAVADVDAEPDLVGKAKVFAVPVWVVYRDGNEFGRAIGENSDLGLSRLIAASTGREP